LGDVFTLSQISQRPGANPEFIYHFLPNEIKSQIQFSDLETALADSLYSGYIKSQISANERVFHNDNLKVPVSFNFREISGLSYEMIERLERTKPQDFGQIRRISGITPAALSILLVHLSGKK
jgi:tRNA U34 5-carboxymethylaminomethyl modifying enzyme MnmG/GidA